MQWADLPAAGAPIALAVLAYSKTEPKSAGCAPPRRTSQIGNGAVATASHPTPLTGRAAVADYMWAAHKPRGTSPVVELSARRRPTLDIRRIASGLILTEWDGARSVAEARGGCVGLAWRLRAAGGKRRGRKESLRYVRPTLSFRR